MSTVQARGIWRRRSSSGHSLRLRGGQSRDVETEIVEWMTRLIAAGSDDGRSSGTPERAHKPGGRTADFGPRWMDRDRSSISRVECTGEWRYCAPASDRNNSSSQSTLPQLSRQCSDSTPAVCQYWTLNTVLILAFFWYIFSFHLNSASADCSVCWTVQYGVRGRCRRLCSVKRAPMYQRTMISK